MPHRLACRRLARRPLSPAVDRDRRRHPRRRRRFSPVFPRRFALPQQRSMTLEDSTVPFTDADSRRAVVRALRNVAIAVALGAPLSGSGIFEWLRLMTAITARMDTDPNARPSPVAPVLAGFFLRLGIALVLLYV